jgi:prepilin peptidase CpaA
VDILLVLLLSVLPVLVITAGLTDLTTMTIPNWISLALVAGFVPAAFAVGLGPGQIALHFGFGVAALFVGVALFALNLLGGGDAKLIAAASLWLGLDAGLVFLLATAVTGGLFSLSLILARGSAGQLAGAGPPWLERLLEPKGDIPYGVAIATGVLIAFPHSPLISAFTGG